jgi:hypothetical protein
MKCLVSLAASKNIYILFAGCKAVSSAQTVTKHNCWTLFLRRLKAIYLKTLFTDDAELNIRLHSQFYFTSVVFRSFSNYVQITVAMQSTAWIVFVRSNTGIVASNPTWNMDACVRLFCVWVVLCVGSGLAMGWSPSKEYYRLCTRSRNWKSGQGPTKGCRAIDGWMDGWMDGRTDGQIHR